MSELLISHIMGVLSVFFFFFKQGVLFGKGTLVSHTLSPCEFRMHIEVSIIIKEV